MVDGEEADGWMRRGRVVEVRREFSGSVCPTLDTLIKLNQHLSVCYKLLHTYFDSNMIFS